MPTIGVLALQGDFVEHEAVLRRLNARVRQVRASDALGDLDGLIIPGGESTTFCRLMEGYHLYGPLRTLIEGGLPVWGTCAGLIILSKRVTDLGLPTLDALDITVRRNAYGRQADSFEATLSVPALAETSPTNGPPPFHAVFIRAPVVDEVGERVEVLAHLPDDAGKAAGSPVALRQGPILATAFHPELTDDDRFHRYFLSVVAQEGRGVAAK